MLSYVSISSFLIMVWGKISILSLSLKVSVSNSSSITSVMASSPPTCVPNTPSISTPSLMLDAIKF